MGHPSLRAFLFFQSVKIRRWTLASACLFYSVFVIMDVFRFPSELAAKTIPLRIILVLLPLIYVTFKYLFKDPKGYRWHILITYVSAGLTHSLLNLILSSDGYQIPTVGLMLILFYGTLVTSLPVKEAAYATALIIICDIITCLLIGKATSVIVLNSTVLTIFSAVSLQISKVCHSILVDNYKLIERLHSVSVIDSLTGIHNRQYCDEQATQFLAENSASGKPLTLMMIDFDWFKLFNDTYGHSLGDQALVKITSILSSVCRHPDDFVCRYGGDEFVLFLTDISHEETEHLCQKLNEQVRALSIPHELNPKTRYVSLSIGAVHISNAAGCNFSDLMKQADEAMYRTKRNGRNGYSLLVYQSSANA